MGILQQSFALQRPTPVPACLPARLAAHLSASPAAPTPVLPQGEGVALAELDLGAVAAIRAQRALFRDRRPDMHGVPLTQDGAQRCA